MKMRGVIKAFIQRLWKDSWALAVRGNVAENDVQIFDGNAVDVDERSLDI